MSQALALVDDHDAGEDGYDDNLQFVTFVIHGQLFGIPTMEIQDVHNVQKITPIPLAPPEVAGALNIRGKIVTAVDLRTRLGLSRAETESTKKSIVVEYGHDFYSLLIDEIGDVLSLKRSQMERNSPTMDARWRDISEGIFQLDGKLMIVTSVARLLSFVKP